MYTLKKERLNLSSIEYIELMNLNGMFQSNNTQMSKDDKERIWSLMNR